MTVPDDVHRNLFARIGDDVPGFGCFAKLVNRELETVAVGQVICVTVVFQPAVLDCFPGGIRNRPVANAPVALLLLFHFIAEEPDVNFVAVALGHSMMIQAQRLVFTWPAASRCPASDAGGRNVPLRWNGSGRVQQSVLLPLVTSGFFGLCVIQASPQPGIPALDSSENKFNSRLVVPGHLTVHITGATGDQNVLLGT